MNGQHGGGTAQLQDDKDQRSGGSQQLFHQMAGLRQHVIVMRGRFAAWESLALDLDIMVEVHVKIKE